MTNELGKLKYENAVLRTKLAKIGGFASSWVKQYTANAFGQLSITALVLEKFVIIEKACNDALDETPAPHQVRLTFVMVGCTVFSGTLIDDNPEGFEGCVEIEVVDVDSTCARMRVIGTPTGKINEPPEIVGSVE